MCILKLIGFMTRIKIMISKILDLTKVKGVIAHFSQIIKFDVISRVPLGHVIYSKVKILFKIKF